MTDNIHTIPGRLLTLDDVTAVTRMGKSYIYEQMKKGAFPKPIKLARKAVRWRCSDIKEWLESLAATA